MHLRGPFGIAALAALVLTECRTPRALPIDPVPDAGPIVFALSGPLLTAERAHARLTRYAPYTKWLVQTSIVDDLNGDHDADVAILGLDGWVNRDAGPNVVVLSEIDYREAVVGVVLGPDGESPQSRSFSLGDSTSYVEYQKRHGFYVTDADPDALLANEEAQQMCTDEPQLLVRREPLPMKRWGCDAAGKREDCKILREVDARTRAGLGYLEILNGRCPSWYAAYDPEPQTFWTWF